MLKKFGVLLQLQGNIRFSVPMRSGGRFLLFLLLWCTAVCTAVYPGLHPRRAEPVASTCFLLSRGTGGFLPARTAIRRVCGRAHVPVTSAHLRMMKGGGLTGADELAGGDGTKDSRFVSRKLTDALEDMPATKAQVAERGSKRAWVRKAASRVVTIIVTAPRSLTQRLFPGPEIPPLMGEAAEAEAGGQLEQLQRTDVTRSDLAASIETDTFSNPARLENERVFDLLDKYSQRHSNGTVPVTATISESSERKPLKKSKYADLGAPQSEEVKKSKSGKVLQRSKYADVWSVQDEAMGKSAARPTAQGLAGGKASKRSDPEEPQSRLEQLMAGYSNRYPTDGRDPRQETPSLQLNKGIPNAAASLTGEAILTPAVPASKSSTLKEGSNCSSKASRAEAEPVLAEDEATDDTTGGKGSGAGGQGTSLAAVHGRRGPKPVPDGPDSSEAGLVGKRVTRKQLRSSLPLPPVTRLVGLIFSWILVSLMNVFDAFADNNSD